MNALTPEANSLFVLLGLILFFLALFLGFIAWVALRDDTDPYDKAQGEREKERLLANANRELERRPLLNS